MSIRFFTVIAALAFFALGCGESNREPVVLNNGQKWKVDQNMMVFLKNMEKDVMDFAASDTGNYELLSGKLEDNLGKLTANCTMKGPAHDELHKWLLPFINLTKSLSKSENKSEKAAVFKEIQNSFVEFNQFFN